MPRILGLSALLLSMSIGGAATHDARAASLVLDVNPGGSQVACGNCGTTNGATYGWSFTLSSQISIDGLGVWDSGADGLGAEIQVGLWNAAGTLLASATVTDTSTSVASASAAGVWLFEDIAALTLAAGNYRIGSVFFSTLPPANVTGGFTTISAVSGVAGIASPNESGFVFPTGLFTPIFGPTMRLADVAVPAPASLAIFGLGLAGLLAARRRQA